MGDLTMRTVRTQFTDAEIRAQAAHEDVRDLRDMRYPSLRFRFGRDRQKGTWHVVLGAKWHKVGRWPGLTAKAAIGALPAVTARLAADPAASASAGAFRTLDEVLTWHLERQERNRSLSAKRKAGIKSMITRHLVPSLKGVTLLETNKATLDRVLFWPMQEAYAAGYVRQAYGVLVSALRRAHRLGLVTHNPMGSMRFPDFVQERIVAKEAGLRPTDLPALLPRLQVHYERDPGATLLALLMLCHGTRVGETRQAKWRHVLLKDRRWIIPAVAAKSRAEHVLPLTDQVAALLEAHLERQRARGIESVYLFPGRAGKPLSEKQANEVFVRLGGDQWRSHDLRKLARTCWTELGVDHLIGELLLNHAIKGVQAAYIQTTAQDKKREALELWHGHLDSHGFASIHTMTFARPQAERTADEAAQRAGSGAFPLPQERRLQNDISGPDAGAQDQQSAGADEGGNDE
ncbi:tyrosine-type recombinase/integrase [Ectopseudomonas khazarica]|uniref:tyrosine-type recombinase/integrase n=1 Tax=Ectopseudomonas khazarica TaxID=2502979 RepID=UPI0040344694